MTAPFPLYHPLREGGKTNAGNPACLTFTTQPGFINSDRVGKRSAIAVSVEETALLDELKAAAQKLGIEVREERLLRDVGYRVRSGACRVRENEVILLDRQLQVNARIDLLIDELAGRALDNIYLSPAARTLLERAAAKEKRSDACSESTGG